MISFNFKAAIKQFIHWQHIYAPIPLPLFDRIFANPILSKVFRTYGHAVFMGCYLRRRDNFTYWNSKESLYWHFLRQLDVPHDVLRIIEAETELRDFLQGGEINVVEIGFGIGKTSEALIKSGLFKYRHLTALDTNRAICEYVRRHRSFPSFSFILESIAELTNSKRSFDLLVVHGGGLMHLSPAELSDLFGSLITSGCKAVMVTQEGSADSDVFRDDGTAMYDFKSRLVVAEFSSSRFIEHIGDNGILKLFAMLPSRLDLNQSLSLGVR